MKRNRSIGTHLSHRETTNGLFYLAFQLLFLPGFLTFISQNLPNPLSTAEVNFLFYLINFIAVLLIFRRFLGNALDRAFQHPIYTLEAAILGFVFYYLCKHAINWGIEQFFPGFSNRNDEAIAAMCRENYFLMFIGTVILVPPVEECFYRGLIFRNLYGKSKWAAYTISIAAFTIIHIIGYIGSYSALDLLLAALQYLPACLCLAWAYTRSDTIFAPILIHAAINFIGINELR